MTVDLLLMDILKYCFTNKIIYEYNTNGEMNECHYVVEDDKLKFIVTIVNEKDKNLKNMLNNGFDKLKNFFQEFSSK
jgi:hypothetical protein